MWYVQRIDEAKMWHRMSRPAIGRSGGEELASVELSYRRVARRVDVLTCCCLLWWLKVSATNCQAPKADLQVFCKIFCCWMVLGAAPAIRALPRPSLPTSDEGSDLGHVIPLFLPALLKINLCDSGVNWVSAPGDLKGSCVGGSWILIPFAMWPWPLKRCSALSSEAGAYSTNEYNQPRIAALAQIFSD